jgi:hypothetical protein
MFAYRSRILKSITTLKLIVVDIFIYLIYNTYFILTQSHVITTDFIADISITLLIRYLIRLINI